MIRKLLAAAAMAVACLTTPTFAADPPTTSLPLSTPSGTVYNEATWYDGSRYWLMHMTGGWTGLAWKPWTMDANGYGGVNVFSSVLPAGAATDVKLAQIITALGSPLQSGGSVNVLSFPTSLGKVDANGNLTVTLTNPTPSTQPVSAAALPLPAGAATAARQDQLLAALGSPLQTGGSVSVGASALPTGAATAGNQTAANTSLSALATATGAPSDPKSTATDATAASQTALLKGQIDRLQAILTALGSPVQAGAVQIVAGQVADGVTPVNPAVHVAGVDQNGAKRTLATGASGVLASPSAGTGNRVTTRTSVAANTSTVVCPAAPMIQALTIDLPVSGTGIGWDGQTLTTATIGTATSSPNKTTAAANYTWSPTIPPSNAVTIYSPTAFVAVCEQDLRQ